MTRGGRLYYPQSIHPLLTLFPATPFQSLGVAWWQFNASNHFNSLKRGCKNPAVVLHGEARHSSFEEDRSMSSSGASVQDLAGGLPSGMWIRQVRYNTEVTRQRITAILDPKRFNVRGQSWVNKCLPLCYVVNVYIWHFSISLLHPLNGHYQVENFTSLSLVQRDQ
jgi:hypothetical protein